jgi:hypothetical protein
MNEPSFVRNGFRWRGLSLNVTESGGAERRYVSRVTVYLHNQVVQAQAARIATHFAVFKQPTPYRPISRIVKFRAKENLARAEAKAKKK